MDWSLPLTLPRFKELFSEAFKTILATSYQLRIPWWSKRLDGRDGDGTGSFEE